VRPSFISPSPPFPKFLPSKPRSRSAKKKKKERSCGLPLFPFVSFVFCGGKKGRGPSFSFPSLSFQKKKKKEGSLSFIPLSGQLEDKISEGRKKDRVKEAESYSDCLFSVELRLDLVQVKKGREKSCTYALVLFYYRKSCAGEEGKKKKKKRSGRARLRIIVLY